MTTHGTSYGFLEDISTCVAEVTVESNLTVLRDYTISTSAPNPRTRKQSQSQSHMPPPTLGTQTMEVAKRSIAYISNYPPVPSPPPRLTKGHRYHQPKPAKTTQISSIHLSILFASCKCQTKEINSDKSSPPKRVLEIDRQTLNSTRRKTRWVQQIINSLLPYRSRGRWAAKSRESGGREKSSRSERLG